MPHHITIPPQLKRGDSEVLPALITRPADRSIRQASRAAASGNISQPAVSRHPPLTGYNNAQLTHATYAFPEVITSFDRAFRGHGRFRPIHQLRHNVKIAGYGSRPKCYKNVDVIWRSSSNETNEIRATVIFTPVTAKSIYTLRADEERWVRVVTPLPLLPAPSLTLCLPFPTRHCTILVNGMRHHTDRHLSQCAAFA